MTRLSRSRILGGAGSFAATAALRPGPARAADSITVWWTQGYCQAEDQALKDSVAAFERQSGIKVKLQIINGPDLITKMIASMHINDMPDAVQAVTGGTFLLPRAVWNDQIVEISDVAATQEAEFLPAALNGCRDYNNVTRRGIYAVPIKAATLMEEIWLPLVQDAGFSAGDIPKTQDAFFDFFETVQDRLRAKGRRVHGLGYSMATKDADSNNLFSSFLVAYGGGNIVTPQGRLNVDDPAVRQAAASALQRLTSAYKKGLVPPGAINNWGDPGNNNAFYARQGVMTPNATISIAVAQMEKQDQYYRDIITTGVPYGNDGRPVPSILGATPLFIPKGTKNIDGAKVFIRYFIQPANLNTYLKQARGRWLPVMPSALVNDPYWLDPADPHRPVAAKYGLQLPTLAPWQTFNPAYAQVTSEQIWTQAEASITQKGMTVEQATEAAIARIKTIFQKYEIA